jgi:hypothetical protein
MEMKKEYDFSKGERGKFYNPKAEINLPIYLEPDNLAFVEVIAKKKQSDLTTIVNELIRSDIHIIKAVS